MVEDVLSIAGERVEVCIITEGCSCGRDSRGRAESCGCERMLFSVLKVAVADVLVVAMLRVAIANERCPAFALRLLCVCSVFARVKYFALLCVSRFIIISLTLPKLF